MTDYDDMYDACDCADELPIFSGITDEEKNDLLYDLKNNASGVD